LKQDKEYIGIMRVHKDITKEKIEEKIKKKFLGKIMQKPPVKSRVKREFREREIKKFEILEQDGRDFLFLAEVQAGTYIRKLIDDLGKEIGGAHMLELRRTRACIFPESESITLYELDKLVKEGKLDEKLIDASIAIKKILPEVQIRKDNVDKILHGKPIYNEDLARKYKLKEGEIIAVFLDKRFIETARVVKDREIFAKPEFVLN
jgi:H/ACA ribonucleoprotein complex subunit 4